MLTIDDHAVGGCVEEVFGNVSRSGTFSSASLEGKNGGNGNGNGRSCRIVFKGNPGDVVIIQFTSYKLR